jgi:glycosyltransferase involved in cell wall biosynthesis
LSEPRPLKVAIVYRVIQQWRVPVFAQLSAIPGIKLCLFYGDDFEGTKVKSYAGQVSFKAIQVPSFRIRSKTNNGGVHIPFSPGLYKQLKEFRPDVIICEGASNGLNNIVSWIYAKLSGKPILQWGLGAIDGRRRSVTRKMFDLVFRPIERSSSGAIAYSSFGASYYRKLGLSNDRIFVAVNVVDTEQRLQELKDYCYRSGHPLPSPLPSRYNVLFVGSLSENKEVEKLIRAFAEFLLLHPKSDASLTILGEGPDREKCETLVKDLGIASQVTFHGQVTRDVASYFYKASVFVLPGLGGLAVSDALVHGIPVICTIGDGCEKDLVQDGVNGWMIPNLSQPILTQCLTKLYEDRELAASMRREAHKFATGPFGIRQYVATIHAAIQACAND